MNWTIDTLEYAVSVGDLTNVVTTVHWSLLKEQEGRSAMLCGAKALALPEGDFVPWEDLTADMVTEWLLNALGEERLAQIEAEIDANLYAQANPISGSGLPW